MLRFDKGTGQYKNWIISEDKFDAEYSGKAESVMTQGNGYLGLRAVYEEPYAGQTRGLFVAGTYNKAFRNETTELPNAADFTEIRIWLDNEPFSMDRGTVLEYSKELILKNGEIVRTVLWESPYRKRYKLVFKKFVSLDDLHLICIKAEITCLDIDAQVRIVTGIDGRMTNSGSQHFIEDDKRVYDRECLQLIQTTSESNIDFVFNCACSLKNGKSSFHKKDFHVERRSIFGSYEFRAEKDSRIVFEKYANVFTSRDKEYIKAYRAEELKEKSLEHIKKASREGYDVLFKKSSQRWQDYWENCGVEIESSNAMDQMALRFTQYHLLIMTPAHDERFSIAAKGLTGEGYKGHIFWDTELFILPYFQYTMPYIAGQLLKFRHLTLEGARDKAQRYGYGGAMYPWEVAFSGEEETPEWAALNIITGKPQRIWSGIKEHHITADIAYAVWQHYLSTGDWDFMRNCGIETMLECAGFWCSRASWNAAGKKSEIRDVIGPDEYTEHIDNNAYTNHMAGYVLKKTAELIKIIKETDKKLFAQLEQKFGLTDRGNKYAEISENLYLPQPGEGGIIPQDDTFLKKSVIDISKYRESDLKQSILLDYSREQVINLQVLKQADVVMLLYTLKRYFDKKVIRANWKYYEEKTIHDSSLSMAVHCITAVYSGDISAAYDCFKEACLIDIGQNPHSSDTGIHAAALGGVWLAAVFGFGGVFNNEGRLELDPVLPDGWTGLKFAITWKNKKVWIEINKNMITLTSTEKSVMDIRIYGKDYAFEERLSVPYKSGGGHGLEQYRAVIFDLDGVIVSTDEQHFEAWNKIAEEEGIYFDREINNRLRGVSRMESLEILLERSEKEYTSERKQELAQKKNEYYKALIQRLTPQDILPGVRSFLDSLRGAGIKTAIASSSKNARTILRLIGLESQFDVIVSGEDISKSKPDPEVYQIAALRLGLEPGVCLVVEDARAGVDAALVAGMKVMGVGDAASYARSTIARSSLENLTLAELIEVL